MNVAQYDLVKVKLDKDKSWFRVKDKTLYTKEIKNHRYCTLAKRYDKENDYNHYYIIMSDERIDKNSELRKEFDNYGRLKIRLSPIVKSSSLFYIKEDTNIKVEQVDVQRDGEVYEIYI